MIADQEQISATLPQWEVKALPDRKPPAFRDEQAKRGFSWMHLALTSSGVVLVVLIVAAISIPNLLRSRIASNPAGGSSKVGSVPFLAPENAGVTGQAFRDEAAPKLAIPARLISYQVSMTLEVKEFDRAKSRLREIMEAEGGYMAQANFVETPNQPRRANLVMRVPAMKLATILGQVRDLGGVREEHLNSEEVTEQVVDLEARLKNARSTEQRLIDVLNNRTGKVGDILQVEQEIARTREQIERMEAQRQNLLKRVEMANLTLTLVEESKAELQPAPVGTLRQLWNALVEGWENFSQSILGIVFFLARYGLSLILWGGIGWGIWRLVGGPLVKLARPGE